MISIFAKRAFLNTNPGQEFEWNGQIPKRGHMMRVSSMIRGDQIAKRLGAKLNPEKGYEKDVCVYVKPHVQPGNDFKFEGKRSYLDIVDGWGLIPLLEKHPEVGVIVCSKQDKLILENILPNKIVFIPQHHANFDNLLRTRKKIRTVGIIGTEDAFEWIPEDIKKGLEERKINLLTYSKFFTREDIINFYQRIDLQLVWRPYRMRLSNPLKIVNSSSFGIPTIAYSESVFHEMFGCYVGVKDSNEFLKALDNFIDDNNLYQEYSDRCVSKAEEYYIDKVAELYKKL